MNNKVEIKSGLAGRYRLVATKPDGSQRIVADWFDNLITDIGLDSIGNAAITQISACVVGSGSTAPSFADSALVAQVASTTTVQSNTTGSQPSAPYYGWRRAVYRFAAGVAAGNLAEVGIKCSNGNLFSRALILDGGGSPTTITILIDEVLDVTYEHRIYPSLVDATGTVDISGISYDYTARASFVTAGYFTPQAIMIGGVGGPSGIIQVYSGAINASITGGPSGSAANSGAPSLAAYTPGSYQRDATFPFGLNDGNVGGALSALVFLGYGVNMGLAQIQYDPVIPKDNTKIMTLAYRHIWARATI